MLRQEILQLIASFLVDSATEPAIKVALAEATERHRAVQNLYLTLCNSWAALSDGLRHKVEYLMLHSLSLTAVLDSQRLLLLMQDTAQPWFQAPFQLILSSLVPLLPAHHDASVQWTGLSVMRVSHDTIWAQLQQLLSLNDLWQASDMACAMARLDTRVLAVFLRGLCLLLRPAVELSTTCTFFPLQLQLISDVRTLSRLVGTTWHGMARNPPFFPDDLIVIPRNGFRFSPPGEEDEAWIELCHDMHAHWLESSVFPGHDRFRPMLHYMHCHLELPCPCARCHAGDAHVRIGTEARMFLLIGFAPAHYWFSEEAHSLALRGQDADLEQVDDTWIPWTWPPLPPHPFLIPFRPGQSWFYPVLDEDAEHNVRLRDGGGCSCGATSRWAGRFCAPCCLAWGGRSGGCSALAVASYLD